MAAYNGWTNYETWLVALWFGDAFQSLADEAIEPDPGIFKDWLDDFLSDDMPSQAGFIADCVNAVIGAVDWRDIARHHCNRD